MEMPESSDAPLLVHGDCLEVMPTLPAQSVQMVFADLPFGIVRRHWDQLIDFQLLWPCLRTIANRKSRFIFTAVFPFAADLVASNKKLFRHDLVWNKMRSTGFLNIGRRPLRQHEHILIFGQGLGTYNPQKTRGLSYKMKRRSADLNFMDNINNDSVKHYDGARHPISILNITRTYGKSLHPTQKPVALLEWLIKTYTNPGDTVLDPVAGSGTTAIAAMRTGRKAICIEKDATYFTTMTKRVADERARMHQSEMAL